MKRSLTSRIILIIVLVVAAAGCTDSNIDRLNRINSIIEENPRRGLAMLDSVDTLSLNSKEKEYFNFLSIKAPDKCFIIHKTDVRIRRALAYYESHNSPLYPEVLYYAGRVYSDLGDGPKSLKNYQKALEIIPEEDIKLKGKIMVNLGWQLNSMRLWHDAMTYYEQAIDIDRQLQDSLRMMYDMETMAWTLIVIKQFNKADKSLSEIRDLAKRFNPAYIPLIDVYRAKIKYKQDDFKGALEIIRPVVQKVESRNKHVALAYGALIYRANGIQDTALMYARELIGLDYFLNKKTGYEVILSPELVKYSEQDSILVYVDRYRDLIDDHLQNNGDKAAIIQNAMFNYRLHDKDRAVAVKQSSAKTVIIVSLVIVIFGLVILYLSRTIRSKNQQIKLRDALDLVETLKTENYDKDRQISEMKEKAEAAAHSPTYIREKLMNSVMELYESMESDPDALATIKDTETYRLIREYVDKNAVIPYDSKLWEEIDAMVSQSYPEFKSRLSILSTGKLNTPDYRLALLIKCGLKQGETAILLGRSKNTISSRRRNLCNMILQDADEPTPLNRLDRIIAIL